ncbi:MAG TPA: ATP-binding protein [Jatrophihabitans sp.]
MSAATNRQHHVIAGNRYVPFLTIVVLSALTPAVPHSFTPDYAWWAAAIGFIAIMIGVGYLAARRPATRWLATLAPLLLFPAIHALRCSDGNALAGFGPLIDLPVIWFALYGRMFEVWLAVLGGAMTLFLPIVVVGAPQFPSTSWRGYVLLVVISAAIGPLIHRLVSTRARSNSALRRSEAEFRATFENAPIPMAVVGLHGASANRWIRVNRALCELFGRSAEELTSVKIVELTHPDDRELTETRFDQALEPDAPHRIEKRYLHRSGRTIWASVSYSVIRDDNGDPSRLVTQIEDLGVRRESDQALLDAIETDREATERLKQIDRIRSEMASTVSHELRTPLTSAAGYVELLVEGDAGPLTDEQRDMLDTVARSLTRLDGIVDDVLGMASPGQHGPVDPGTADLGAVLQAAIDGVALQAATRGQDLIVQNGVSGALVAANPGRIERVLVNLLTNALKFTPEDGKVTVVGTRNGGEACVAVIDTGVGIAKEDQARIFERFYRAGAASANAPSGTGLGLAIAKTITTQYGGKLTVDSEPGTGATFTLTLPLRGAL